VHLNGTGQSLVKTHCIFL